MELPKVFHLLPFFCTGNWDSFVCIPWILTEFFGCSSRRRATSFSWFAIVMPFIWTKIISSKGGAPCPVCSYFPPAPPPNLGGRKQVGKDDCWGRFTIVKSVWKWMFFYKWSLYDLFWPFIVISVFIFHKTDVLTVILRCLMGLNLEWVKSYGLRCSPRPNASSANSQKIATDK